MNFNDLNETNIQFYPANVDKETLEKEIRRAANQQNNENELQPAATQADNEEDAMVVD